LVGSGAAAVRLQRLKEDKARKEADAQEEVERPPARGEGAREPNEERRDIQYYVFRDEVPGTVPVYDWWMPKDTEHTFHAGEPWPHEVRQHLQFHAYAEPRAGAEPVHAFWNGGAGEHTFHFGEPWPGETRGSVQFYAFRHPLQWRADAACDGPLAADRVRWLVGSEGMAEDAARRRVMGEFPEEFAVGAFVDGKFPHTLSVVKDGNGNRRLHIAVTPRDPEAVALVAVHYSIGQGEPLNFDIPAPEPGTHTHAHMTPSFGPECHPGADVHYWLAAEVGGLTEEMPEGAPQSGAKLHWRAQ